MPSYEYVCPTDGSFTLSIRGDVMPCPHCENDSQRRWSFKIDSSFQPHYSPAFGCYISSMSQAKALAAYQSEKQSLETGREVNYQIVDSMDDAAHGITPQDKEQYLDNTRRRAHNGEAFAAQADAAAAEATRVHLDERQKKIDQAAAELAPV